MSAQLLNGTNLSRNVSHGTIGKRRKIRKGTFSCWECKRRKKRCQIDQGSDSACTNCQRLGAQCISQEVEESSVHGELEMERRLDQIEALVAELEKQKGHGQRKEVWREMPGTPTQLEVHNLHGQNWRSQMSNVKSPFPLLLTPTTESRVVRCSILSDYIESLLPTTATANAIVAQGRSPLAILETSTAISASSGREIRNSQPKHPLRLARDLIHLALCLERLDLNKSKAMEAQLEAPSSIVARRYVDAARYVTSQDFLIDSFDSLEILMLESSFEMSTGNVRVAWLNVRRALNIAQLLIREGNTKQAGSRENWIRLRLVLFDRVLSLMLGVPCEMFVNEQWIPTDMPMTSLEDSHAKISGHLIARNIRMQQRLQCNSSLSNDFNDYEQTRSIDKGLKQAMRTLESFHPANTTKIRIADATKYVDQMHHYDLLVLTHVPYLISGPHLHHSSTQFFNLEYSRFVALSASREVLSRFLVCCNSPQIPNLSGGLSHKTFMSSITLLLAHLSGHALGHNNPFEHQRLGDREILGKVINEMHGLSSAKRSVFDAEVLTKLMAIDQEAANGHLYVARTINVFEQVTQHLDARLQFALPYFGTILVQPQRIDESLPNDLQDHAVYDTAQLNLLDMLHDSHLQLHPE